MTTSQTARPTRQQMREVVGRVVATRVNKLQRGYLDNSSADVAALARLRRGVGKPPGSLLDVLEYTAAPEIVEGWHSDAPSPAEIAVHHGLTLYAMHQQSRRVAMHQSGHRLGRSLRRLAGEGVRDPENRVLRRFNMLGTAATFDEAVHHLRGLVQLLRGKDIPLDYARLSQELYSWQVFGPERVRLVWGRDFHTYQPPTEN